MMKSPAGLKERPGYNLLICGGGEPVALERRRPPDKQAAAFLKKSGAKNFYYSGFGAFVEPRQGPELQKFFASFFQKRSPSLSS
jgi:hypothetical protein